MVFEYGDMERNVNRVSPGARCNLALAHCGWISRKPLSHALFLSLAPNHIFTGTKLSAQLAQLRTVLPSIPVTVRETNVY